MAWSDAARDAAQEARRRNAVRKAGKGGATLRNQYAKALAEARRLSTASLNYGTSMKQRNAHARRGVQVMRFAFGMR